MSNATEVVRPRWSHLEYSWQLDNFWELRALACVEALEDENGSLIWSQAFGDSERGRWQLKLYPYGDLSAAGRGHVSLFLSMDLKSLSKAYAVFGCYLLDEEGNKIPNSGRSFTRQKFCEGSSSWGWSQFVKNEGQSLNKFLTANDSLIVKCEIEIFSGILTSPPESLPAPLTLDQELKAYLCDPRYYNVIILTKEGRELRARSEILKARSKFFANQLKGESIVLPVMSHSSEEQAAGGIPTAAPTPSSQEIGYTSFGLEDDLQSKGVSGMDLPLPLTNKKVLGESHDVVVVDSISADLMENIIQFTHTDECQYHDGNTRLQDALDLLIAAKDLEIESLYKATVRKLCSYLVSKNNALAIQQVAKSLGDRILEDHCTSYLTLCVRDLTKDEIIKTLTSRKVN